LAKHWLMTRLWKDNPAGDGWPCFSCPKKQPRAYWCSLQPLRWKCLIVEGMTYILGLPLIIYVTFIGAGWSLFIIFPAGLLGTTAWGFISERALKRFVEKLKANEWLLCIECGYSLQGLPTQHDCPECGFSYDVTELRKAWAYWIEDQELPTAFAISQRSERTMMGRRKATDY